MTQAGEDMSKTPIFDELRRAYQLTCATCWDNGWPYFWVDCGGWDGDMED